MREFLLDRIRLVRELLESDIEIAHSDIGLILCSVLSACAAERWPGRGIDRARFIELLVTHSRADMRADWICVPALIVNGHVVESDTPYGAGGQSTRIFRGDEIDLDLNACRSKYSNVSVRDCKSCSYAALIYGWLRCGYAHQYAPHVNITHYPPSRHNARVSYIGRGTPDGGLTRMVSFHLDYLIALTEYHADNVASTPDSNPAEWWINAA